MFRVILLINNNNNDNNNALNRLMGSFFVS